MLGVCNCYKRNCKHYLGISQPDGTELAEVNYCEAFPVGIPNDIAYGDNPHNTPMHGTEYWQKNDIVYEKGD